MPLIEISTGRLIKEVQKRPVLYNADAKHYKDKRARRSAWMEVGKAMFSNYNELSHAQKHEIERAIMQRWKTARDAYIRCKGKSNRNSYSFFNMLRFIDNPDYRPNITDDGPSNIDDTSDFITCKDSNYDPLGGSSIHIETQTVDDPTILKEEPNLDTEDEHEYIVNENINEDTETYYDLESCIDEPPSKKTKLLERRLSDSESGMSAVVKLLTETTKQMKNDNMAFFMSMLPIIDKFNDSQKLIFRSEVIKIAAHISSKETDNPLPKGLEATSRVRGKCKKRTQNDVE